MSATPTVAGNAVYFPDWAGNLFAVRRDTGALLWSHRLADYNGRAGSMARVSPAIWGSGYRHLAPGTGNNKVYAFSLP